jgi:metallo-beta-lactamase family protein
VLHHLKHNLWRTDSSIIFAGYQAEGSLGRLLTDGAKKVKIMGETISVGAKIYNMKGFSAHSDKDQMLALFKGMQQQPRAYFIVHGEYDAQTAFADLLRNEMGATTFIPNFGDDVLIDGTDWKVEESKVVMVEPQIQALRDYLRGFEKNYLLYKARMEQIIIHDGTRFEEIKGKLEKIKKYIDDVLKTL